MLCPGLQGQLQTGSSAPIALPAAVRINDSWLPRPAVSRAEWPIGPHANLPPVAHGHLEDFRAIDSFREADILQSDLSLRER